MNLLGNRPIAAKLRRMILITSGLALLVASLGYLTIEFISYRQALVQRAEVLADFIATNSTAALTFNDEKTAARLLDSLNAEPAVNHATLLLADGTQFASYLNATLTEASIQEDLAWLEKIHLNKQTVTRIQFDDIDILSGRNGNYFSPIILCNCHRLPDQIIVRMQRGRLHLISVRLEGFQTV